MSAKRISFEGIDGSGKTTAYNYLISLLKDKELRVLDTREVGNPHLPICVSLRKTVLDPAANLSGITMELIFAAMRIENQKLYKQVEDQYDYIVSDREWLSHLSYTDNNESPEFTKDFYLDVIGKHTKPFDLHVFLNIDPETALKRRNSRNGFVDAIEMKGPEFQRKVYGSFMKYIESENLNMAYIDANQDLEGVRSQVRALVEGLVNV